MNHPTIGVIVLFGGNSTFYGQLIYHFKKRVVTLRNIKRLYGPIIHLVVNIQSIFTSPCWEHFIVPNPLKIGRLGSTSTRREHEVSGILNIQSSQIIVGLIFNISNTLIGGNKSLLYTSQIKRKPVVISLIIGLMLHFY